VGALQRTPSPAWAAVKAAAGAGLDAMLQHAAHAHAVAAVAAAAEGQPPPPPPRISGEWYKMGVQLQRRDSEDEATARARISAAADGRPQSAGRGAARVSAARSAAGAAPPRVDVAAVEADSAAEAEALRHALSRPPPRASQAGQPGPSPGASPTPAGTPRRSGAATWIGEDELAPLAAAAAARAQAQHPPLQPRRYGASPTRRAHGAHDGAADVRHSYAGAAAMLGGGGSFVTDGHAARRNLSPGRYADRLASREPHAGTAVRGISCVLASSIALL
jgi:hypothetical protein